MGSTDDGTEEILNWLAGDVATPPSYVLVGNSTTPFTKDDAQLGNELARYAVDSITKSLTKKTVNYIYTVTNVQLNGQDLKEVGLGNAASNGVMSERTVHATITKTAADSVQYSITLKGETG